MPQFLGVDVGTSTIGALILDSKTGRRVSSYEVPNVENAASDADKARERHEYDAEAIVERTYECIHGAMQGASDKRIGAVGVTGQMHGTILARDGRAISPLIGWQDQRGDELMPGRPETYVERMLQLGGVGGFAHTGCPPATGYMGATLFWLTINQDPRVMPGHAPGIKACFLPDYIVSRLTDTEPGTDPTNAGGSGILDVAVRNWNPLLIQRLGLQADLLPKIHTGGQIIGSVTQAASAATGLSVGTPVRVACGDNQASFAGSVADPAESIFINIGTGEQISAWVPDFVMAETVDTRPYFGKHYLLVGAPLCGGVSYELLRDFFMQAGEKFFESAYQGNLYERMTELAASIRPGADGLTCEPLFTGTRLDPNSRASFKGLTPFNFTPGHFARAILEGIVQELLVFYQDMKSAGISRRSKLIGSGNGIRRNPLLPRIVSSMFGMPLHVLELSDEAASGAAIMAAVAVGEFERHANARHLISYGPEIRG